MPPKKIPMRMCVGCRQMNPKKELIRVVRTQLGDAEEGENPTCVVSIDRTGKAPGRGAYLCQSVECLEKAVKTRALERALEQKIEPEVFEQLKREMTGDG